MGFPLMTLNALAVPLLHTFPAISAKIEAIVQPKIKCILSLLISVIFKLNLCWIVAKEFKRATVLSLKDSRFIGM